LERSNSLLLQLGKEVTDLVATAQSNSDEATLRLAKAIRNGKLLLLLITAASLAGAILIATRYVIPQVVRPIERITRAMSGLAAGDTAIDVPGRDRTDEIGRMADALGVFRDTAIELQKAKERFLKAAGDWRSRSKASPKRSRSMTARITSSCATTNTKRSSILAATSTYRPA
jgi:HAMP domain-containing protein